MTTPMLFNLFWAILEYFRSIGNVVSYSAGAQQRMRMEPPMQAIAKSHKNSLSNTIATYFHSSTIWKENVFKKKKNIVKKERNSNKSSPPTKKGLKA